MLLGALVRDIWYIVSCFDVESTKPRLNHTTSQIQAVRHDRGTKYAAAEIDSLSVDDGRGRQIPFEHLTHRYMLLTMNVTEFDTEAYHHSHDQGHNKIVEDLLAPHWTIRVPEEEQNKHIKHCDDTCPDQWYLWDE